MPEAHTVIAAAAACSTAESWEAVISAVEDALEQLGFPYFSVLEAALDGDCIDLRPLMAKTHAEWLAHYQGAGLSAVDPRLRRARRSARDFFWSEALRDDPDLTAAERGFIAEARRFGLTESYVLPYRTAAGRVFASVLIGSGGVIDPKFRVKVRLLAFELVSTAMRLSAAASGPGPGPLRLSPRQLQCLAWIREGKSSGDIATVLGISARTVDGHVAELLKVLGVRTRVQAVSRALALGLLT